MPPSSASLLEVIGNSVIFIDLFPVSAVVPRLLTGLERRRVLQHPLVEVDDVATLGGVVGQDVPWQWMLTVTHTQEPAE